MTLSALQLPLTNLVKQYAALLAKLARSDVPGQWPEFLPTLINHLEQPDDRVRMRAMLFLYHAVKKIVTRRLAGQRRAFQETAVEVLPIVHGVFTTLFTQVQETFAADGNEDVLAHTRAKLEEARTALKCLRQLIAHGLLDMTLSASAGATVESLPDVARILIAMASADVVAESPLFDSIRKFTRLIYKTLHDVQQNHSVAFAPHLSSSVGFYYQIFHPQPNSDLLQAPSELQRDLRIHAAQFLSRVLKNRRYRADLEPSTSSPSLSHEEVAARAAGGAVLTPDVIAALIHSILTHDLNTRDLLEEDVSGELMSEEMHPSTTPEAAGVHLFLTIAETRPSLVCSVIAPLLSPQSIHTADTHTRPAVLGALKLGAYALRDAVDINALLPTLLQLFHEHTHNRVAVRRRVLQVFASWLPVTLSDESKLELYRLLVPALSAQFCPSVQMEAVSTLTAAVNDPDFSHIGFKPFAEDLFVGVCTFLSEVEDWDARVQIMDALINMIKNVEKEAVRFKSALVTYIPHLWTEAEAAANNTMIMRVVELVTTLLTATESSDGLDEIALPVITTGVDVSRKESEYLLDHALELWEAYLVHMRVCTDELAAAFSLLPPLLDLGDENLGTCMRILQSYILLAHQQLLQPESVHLVVSACMQLSSSVPRQAFRSFIDIVDMCILLAPGESVDAFAPVIQAGLDGFAEHEKHSWFITGYLALACRCMVSAPSPLTNALPSGGERDALAHIWSLIADKYDAITVPKWRKLVALAALACLTNDTWSEIMLADASAILNVVIAAVYEFHTGRTGARQAEDYLVMADAEDVTWRENPNAIPESIRKKEVQVLDPVFRVHLQPHFAETLQHVISVRGTAVLDSLDAGLQTQVRELMGL
ncbi:hypothetical protein PTSG_08485 [Salpingoeca rosetta]|uniref:Importin-7/11-like TPR repeats domain-containing protein n=1 Tax=Salpingoeca rosetta (strain ATCC 50818 / BSB-021) TaxID=946362 RepID=F2UJU1_SALR5|nr:uncharacterized protein PTSG_08485 [Salpingoeca rosetta]EGD77390.1 hypothetical protein PTSG_08485 [Salpingoeca rosetta]|eukprot:XP_004990734.1 hypothetical protein PTSG_08485 [Salpingoeca rosetta]